MYQMKWDWCIYHVSNMCPSLNLIIMSTRPNNEKIRILERGFNATPSLDRCYPLFRFWLYKKLVPFHNTHMARSSPGQVGCEEWSWESLVSDTHGSHRGARIPFWWEKHHSRWWDRHSLKASRMIGWGEHCLIWRYGLPPIWDLLGFRY